MDKKFYCSAKWQELFLFLNSGMTNSCHHPLPHKIPLEELEKNIFALHNTKHKMEMQELLLRGERPKECHMCWHIEDADPTAVSDRMQKNETWSNALPHRVDPNHIPKFIEVIFDNLCNLNCSYCDSGQSSSWAKELEKNGGFDLETDYRNLYQKVHLKPGSTDEHYIKAWFEWWPMIKDHIEVLKFSGGEPLTSPNVQKTIGSIGDAKNLKLNFNSNLTFDKKYLDNIIKISHKFKEIKISASIDATGDIAEFARAGLNFKTFNDNIDYWCKNSDNNSKLSLQSTMNIFNIWGFADLLDYYVSLKEKYNDKVVEIYHTVVRFPEFQSVLNLPLELRKELSHEIRDRSKRFFKIADQKSINYTNKILSYLESTAKPFYNLDQNKLKNDLITFIKRYEIMAKKTVDSVYPKNFLEYLKNPPKEIS